MTRLINERVGEESTIFAHGEESDQHVSLGIYQITLDYNLSVQWVTNVLRFLYASSTLIRPGVCSG